jgi:hypothetical protein
MDGRLTLDDYVMFEALLFYSGGPGYLGTCEDTTHMSHSAPVALPREICWLWAWNGARWVRLPFIGDLERDGDVDLADFAIFQQEFVSPRGPGRFAVDDERLLVP